MKLIEKYILEEIKNASIVWISLFTFIFLIDIIVAMMENIIVKGISIIRYNKKYYLSIYLLYFTNYSNGNIFRDNVNIFKIYKNK